MKARYFLFHGNDDMTSSAALREWVNLFKAKYPDGSCQIIQADELSAEDCKAQLAAALNNRGLFANQQLVVIKRVTVNDKGRNTGYAKAVAAVLTAGLPALDANLTVVVWEANLLKEDNSLLTKFREWENNGQAIIKIYQMPDNRQIGHLISRYLQPDYSLSDDAKRWLWSQYQQYEQLLVIKEGLKRGQTLARDERGWWLRNVLVTSRLLAKSHEISLNILKAALPPLPPGVSIFDLVNAINQKKWILAGELLDKLWQGSGDVYSLLGALRWSWQKGYGAGAPLAKYGLLLLGEVEMCLKNSVLEPEWLVDLLLMRLEEYARAGRITSLLNMRKFWLSGLPKS